MCLLITKREPHNNLEYRYKILKTGVVNKNDFFSIYYYGPWINNRLRATMIGYSLPYRIGESSYRGGIHTFISLEDARKAYEHIIIGRSEKDYFKIIKIKVSGFLGAGFYTKSFALWADGWRGDVWYDAEIIEVCD